MSTAEVAKPKHLGVPALIYGVILPTLTILIELTTQLCADTFFDPLPTWQMTLLVMAVPAANFHLWYKLRSRSTISNMALYCYGATFIISIIYALIMLPLIPLALIAIIYFGLGLLPLAPIFTAIYMGMATRNLSMVKPDFWRAFGSGMGIGFALLFIADLPASATRIAIDMANDGDDKNAISIMRWVGSENDLLHLANGSTGRAGGIGSIFLTGKWGFNIWGFSNLTESQSEIITARILYYRVTGQAYNQSEAIQSLKSKDARWRWDNDQGGDVVGGYIDTLSLESSRIDGSISVENNVAYSEWTVEVANNGNRNAEARFTMVLPEGGVASRATLWINGEPREASIAGRAEVKAAYKKIVTRQRDPLLVTTSGNGRLLVQAFPILSNDVMKFRVGFSAPLHIARDGSRSIAMPAIVEQNFRIKESLQHNIWMEGDVSPKQNGWSGTTIENGASRLKAQISDTELRSKRPRIMASKIASPIVMTAAIDQNRKGPAIAIQQSIAKQSKEKLNGLTILLDGSVTNNEAAQALSNALDGIEENTSVGLIIARDDPIIIERAPWSQMQKSKFVDAIDDTDFVGGVDNIAALTTALENSTKNQETILWIHGPQPIIFPASTAALEQFLERNGSVIPQLIRYQSVAGRSYVLQEKALFETAHEIAPSGDAKSDLQALLSDITSDQPRWEIERTETNGTGPGSPHIIRLWAADKLANGAPYRDDARDEAIDLAHRLNIITPVSGAVVLETEQDYDENGLPIPTSDEVPSVPEPHEWALIILLILFVGWTLHRRGYKIEQLFHKRQSFA